MAVRPDRLWFVATLKTAKNQPANRFSCKPRRAWWGSGCDQGRRGRWARGGRHDLLAKVFGVHDVVNRAGIFDAQRAGHARTLPNRIVWRKSREADQRFKRPPAWCWHHWRTFRVTPLRKKRAAAGRRHRQAACNRARPSGFLESLAALMAVEIARLRFGAPVDAVFSSCVFLSVVAFLVVTQPSNLRGDLAAGDGVFPPCSDSSHRPVTALNSTVVLLLVGFLRKNSTRRTRSTNRVA